MGAVTLQVQHPILKHRVSPTIRQLFRSFFECIVYILTTLTDFLNLAEKILAKGGISKDEGTHLFWLFSRIPNLFLNRLPGESHRL